MKRAFLLGAMAVAAMAVGPGAQDASAGGRKSGYYSESGEHPKSGYYRRSGPQVRGYTVRRGGYSYSYADTIDTYGNPRTQYGGSNLYRDPMLDRQTNAGPFDHGFFFDSGITARGGDSPYMH
jgi:hypothetical protein